MQIGFARYGCTYCWRYPFITSQCQWWYFTYYRRKWGNWLTSQHRKSDRCKDFIFRKAVIAGNWYTVNVNDLSTVNVKLAENVRVAAEVIDHTISRWIWSLNVLLEMLSWLTINVYCQQIYHAKTIHKVLLYVFKLLAHWTNNNVFVYCTIMFFLSLTRKYMFCRTCLYVRQDLMLCFN